MRETSCDTLVVLGPHTRDGHTLFAKNSDRPPVCMHPDPGVSATAAGMVAELRRDGDLPVVAWCALTTPCTSVFLPFPIPLAAPLPAALTTGTGDPDGASAWWRMKALGDAVMRDPLGHTPAVQAEWLAWEPEWLAVVACDRHATARGIEDRVGELLRRQARHLTQLGQTGGPL